MSFNKICRRLTQVEVVLHAVSQAHDSEDGVPESCEVVSPGVLFEYSEPSFVRTGGTYEQQMGSCRSIALGIDRSILMAARRERRLLVVVRRILLF